MLQVAKFSAGSRCVRNATPELEVSRGINVVQTEVLRSQKG